MRETKEEKVSRLRRQTDMGRELQKKMLKLLAHRRKSDKATESNPRRISAIKADKKLQVGRFTTMSVAHRV